MPLTSTADETGAPVQTDVPVSQVPDSNAESSTAPGSTADSPAAQDSRSMLDVVSAALKGPEGKSSDPGKGESPAEAQPAPTAAEGVPEAEIDPVPTEEELKRYAPKTKERIEKLVGALKDKAREAEGYSQKAQAFDQITGFLQGSGLEPEELDRIVSIGSLMKRDPQQALERLRPIYEELSRRSGEVLPDDLAEEVRLGYVSEPRARELARSRAAEQIRSRQLAERDQQAEAERTQRDRQQHVEQATSTAEQWEAQKQQADPDFHLKQARVAELAELEIRRRMSSGQAIKGSQDVIEICDAAYARVTAEIKRFQPPPKEVVPVNGTASPRSQAAPTSLLDAMYGAVGGRR